MDLLYITNNRYIYLITQSDYKNSPVVGYIEKNEPAILATPRPNSC